MFGQTKPIVTWQGFIITGHGLVEAARKLEWLELDAVDKSDWTESEAVAYLAADNEIAKRSDPDLEALNAIVRKLHDESTELSELAFGSTEELLQLLSSKSQQSDAPESSSSEIDVDAFQLDHKCPRCGFEFNDKA